MKIALILCVIVYVIGAAGTFWLHTQMPVTFGLAVMRSLLWPVWISGGLQGSPLPMD